MQPGVLLPDPFGASVQSVGMDLPTPILKRPCGMRVDRNTVEERKGQRTVLIPKTMIVGFSRFFGRTLPSGAIKPSP